MALPKHMENFVTAMQQVYQFPMTVDEKLDWRPPPMKDGHRGRYLWTDAFGVFNFITLSKETSQPHFLVLAAILVETVHGVLGRTRDLSARLPGASDETPLSGGLRIGKNEASGSDGDGQYHHYLTLWMLALNRLSIASGEKKYNDQAISLARATHPAFMYQRDAPRPQMVWKMSIDLSHPLCRSEGNLDPINGLVTYRILQETSGNPEVLKEEISEYQKIVDQKWKGYTSSDTLDLGMTLWTVHWFSDRNDWAKQLAAAAIRDMRILFHESHYLDLPTAQRLAFREFGTCLGIRVHPIAELEAVAKHIITDWEGASRVPIPKKNVEMESLEPMDLVMYAAALCPGAFKRNYLN
ncbi:hypothetical protein D6D28_06966 [Aureobasidium pullulans]|uniref:Uncharacterized protein n=1 Tax=Aureobasidium pullulans TaxID=5580 RepID=A0A4V4HZA9_AURPU|nr:hypothetical protein D6D28_06966 [Aureobasidium pullulans]